MSSADYPSQLLYTQEHEWALHENGIATIGITHHAQHQLGDVVYVELPPVGRELKKDGIFGVVESVKAVSDLFSPVSGEVIAVNEALVNSPETINQDPYETAWMIKIRLTQPHELSHLMSAEKYKAYLSEETK